MPVDAVRLIRKMRGGAQAHLIEASDGHFYVVKFRNNPQHRRILVNEWIGSVFLAYLGISTPRSRHRARLRGFPANAIVKCIFSWGSGRRAIEPGWHFGSRFPGDPARNVVYDFLPDSLLDKVENLGDFLGVLAFDKWMGNADSRQAVFFRARLQGVAARLQRASAAPGLRRAHDRQRLHFRRSALAAHGFSAAGPVFPARRCIAACAAWRISSRGSAGSRIFRKRWWTRR